jgi:hypothetical protein
MTHLESRLIERNITLSMAQLTGIVYEYGDSDCAVVIAKCEFSGQNVGKYRSRLESNGDLVVLIIRQHEAKTIMYRRSNQPLTPEAMNVKQVIDLTQ